MLLHCINSRLSLYSAYIIRERIWLAKTLSTWITDQSVSLSYDMPNSGGGSDAIDLLLHLLENIIEKAQNRNIILAKSSSTNSESLWKTISIEIILCVACEISKSGQLKKRLAFLFSVIITLVSQNFYTFWRFLRITSHRRNLTHFYVIELLILIL